MKFKVGDKVRITKEIHFLDREYIGKVGVVESIHNNAWYSVRGEGLDSAPDMSEIQLELVKDTQERSVI